MTNCDEIPAGERKNTLRWSLFILSSLLICFLFSVYVIYRRYRPDPEFLVFLSTTIDGLSILSAGSVIALIVGLGKEHEKQFEKWFKRTVGNRYVRAVAALLVILSMALVWIGLPAWARSYNNRGMRLHLDGQTSMAIEQLQAAVSLYPGYPQVHVNLGLAYETFLDFDRAIEEYQIALEQDATLDVAYINLGRLYLQHRGDPNNAIAVLRTGQSLVQNDALYALHKNMGWAHCEKGLYQAALEDLDLAVQSKPDYAETHALMARVFEILDDKAAAQTAWENVLRYAQPDGELALVARHHLQSPSSDFGKGCAP